MRLRICLERMSLRENPAHRRRQGILSCYSYFFLETYPPVVCLTMVMTPSSSFLVFVHSSVALFFCLFFM